MMPQRLTARMRCQLSSGPKLLLSGPMPALFIRISVPPNCFRTAASSAATCSKRLTSTSAVMTSAAPPFATDDNCVAASASRPAPISAMQTFMPRPANRVAAARPMPEAPPVITATLWADMAACGMGGFLRTQIRLDYSSARYALATMHEGAWEVFSRYRPLRSTRAPLRTPDLVAQRLQLSAHRLCGVALDLAVARDQREAERRQHRAAAVLAAGLPLDGGLAADAVDLVDQVPRPLVGHVHGAAGGRDRAAFIDVLQQRDFSRSDPPFRIEIDTDAEGGKRFRFLHGGIQLTNCRLWLFQTNRVTLRV